MSNSSPLHGDKAQRTPAFLLKTELNKTVMMLVRPLPTQCCSAAPVEPEREKQRNSVQDFFAKRLVSAALLERSD
jgi:hypothetical protein